ncbi:UNVERIFIED_CONTAM: hypothetical protein HDU68_007885 [Siphonaria sp. JEL0065]|nr:hypothetical protein HDU68_007885 [Siphonaria sp. JEL0065]
MNEFEQKSLETLKKDGIVPKLVVQKDVEKLMGLEFAKEFPYGYFNSSSGFAYSGLTIKYVYILAQEAGVNFVIGSQAGAFAEYLYNDDSKQTVTGIVTADGTKHYGDWVLMAAGSWTPSLVPQLDGLCTVSGQPVIHFKLPDSLKPKFQQSRFPVWFADVSSTGFYGFPLNGQSGELKIANHGPGYISSFHKDTKPETSGTVKYNKPTPSAIPKSAVETYRKFIGRVFPESNQLDISRTRLCWYCESWDGNFYIDAVPGVKNLFVATGGSGHGFKFVPVLGDVIADIMEGKEGEDVRNMFGWRERKGGMVDAIRQKTNLGPFLLEKEELATEKDLVGITRARI